MDKGKIVMGREKNILHILHVLFGLGIGGAENWLRSIFKFIDPNKYRLDVLIHSDKKDYAEEVIKKGGRIIYCPYSKNIISYAKNFKNCLQEYGPYDVIHSHLSSAGLHMLLAAKAGVPVRIAHCHTNDSLELQHSSFYRRAGLKAMQYLTHRYATAGLAVSQRAMHRFGAEWSSDPRWRIFYCGIDLGPFREEINPGIIRQDLGLPENAFVVGHVGRIDHLKNHSYILDIFAKLMELDSNSCLFLVGDGPLHATIRDKSKKLGINKNVYFAGWRRDVARLMKGAMDVFLLPSLSEGLPLVLMESQAAGLPALITDTITEEIEIIKPLFTRLSLQDAPDKWARALLSMKDNKKHFLNEQAITIMEQCKFNVLQSCRTLTSLYDKLYQKSL